MRWNTQDPAARAEHRQRLASLFPEPLHTVLAPPHTRNGIVLAFPHSGRAYPKQWVQETRLSALHLRRSEDAFMDELVALGPAEGFARITASFPRAWVDVNRHPEMVDPRLFHGVDALSIGLPPQVQAGLGVVPRVVAEGMPIYRHKLALPELEARLAHAWHPYHTALTQCMAETGPACLLVDCHSMPGPCNRGSRSPLAEIVLGNGHGTTCDAAIMEGLSHCFVEQGFSVSHNNPYAGGYTVRAHGQSQSARQGIQIELCRSLYMDEKRVQKSATFADTSRRVTQALTRFAQMHAPTVPK